MNNKPDWKDAPDWAVWLAQDANGEWYWYEEKPRCGGMAWRSDRTDMRMDFSGVRGDCNLKFRDTLERRPAHLLDELMAVTIERRRLVEALRPLARAAANYRDPRAALEPLHPINGNLLRESDARNARDLLRELGEWPADMVTGTGPGEVKSGQFSFDAVECPDEFQRQVDEVLACVGELWPRPPAADLKTAKAEKLLQRIGCPAGIHPRARCNACDGAGTIFDHGGPFDCADCNNTGRRHINGKPFYAAEEVAEFARTEREERDLPPYPATCCGFPGGMGQP